MEHHKLHQPDFGTGQKKLGIYLIGVISCALLTLLAFWVVMSNTFSKWESFAIIYFAAFIQFFIQLLCFLRLNIQTQQGKINVMTFLFTCVILTTLIVGSLWIMWSLNYNMMN